MANTISNSDDTIDSRDIIERIELLESGRDDYDDAAHWAASFPDDAEELRILTALAEEASQYSPDWAYGSQLIHESYFEQAMDEMVADCYELPEIPSFMTIALDYDALKQDYTEVDFNGVTYYVR